MVFVPRGSISFRVFVQYRSKLFDDFVRARLISSVFMIEQNVRAIVVNGVRTDKRFVLKRTVFDDERHCVDAESVDADVQPIPEYVLPEQNINNR